MAQITFNTAYKTNLMIEEPQELWDQKNVSWTRSATAEDESVIVCSSLTFGDTLTYFTSLLCHLSPADTDTLILFNSILSSQVTSREL